MLYQWIKNADFKALPGLIILSFKNLGYVLPTLRATAKAMKIAKETFPKTHFGNGKGNAFKHAFWNILILKSLNPSDGRTMEKALSYTEKITLSHENVIHNPPLPRAMDLHNNEFGRQFFILHRDATEAALKALLLARLEEAIPIDSLSEIDQATGQMVYITKE